MKNISMDYDVVVVGGGMSGVCAAIASARHGAKTALIQNRPVLGGNASSEIRMHICGADFHAHRKNARETGIMEEILLEHKRRNPNHSFSVLDTILWEKVNFQENLDLYLNTHMEEVEVVDKCITSIKSVQLTTEKVFTFRGKLFVDTTGDMMLSHLAGATYMEGREGKEVFGESYAPDEDDSYVMGNSLLFRAVDTGEPVEFIPYEWANTYTEEDLRFRGHGELTSGYWWIELGGDGLDIKHDGEILRDDLLKALYGIWDHIKNSGNHPEAENLDLEWVGFVPGKRESRRVVGDYVLREQDILEGRVFDDAVAYGGWHMDMHVVGGLKAVNEQPTHYIPSKPLYTIPLRSLYSKDIHNLFIGGRGLSASHMAFGSTRVMATCGVIGQAIGTAAGVAIEKGKMPKQLMEDVKEVQKRLMADDCYLPGYINEDEEDNALRAQVTASTSIEGYPVSHVIDGYQRDEEDGVHMWMSQGHCQQWLQLTWKEEVNLNELHIKFDSNLSREIMCTLSKNHQKRQSKLTPPELVKSYGVELFLQGEKVFEKDITNNYLRFNKLSLSETITCDAVRITVKETNGDDYYRVVEVRAY